MDIRTFPRSTAPVLHPDLMGGDVGATDEELSTRDPLAGEEDEAGVGEAGLSEMEGRGDEGD